MTQGDSKVLKFLVKSGSLSQEHYDQLLNEAKEVRLSPDALLEAKKLIPEEEISQAKSSIYNLPGAELYGLSVDRKILQIIPRETAENYQVVVFAKEGKVLKTAILNPGDFKAREAVNFIARQNNLKVEFYTAPASALKNILAQYTGLAIEVEEAVGAAEKRFAPTGKKIELGLEEMSQAAPIAKLVASILKYAVDNQASDVHIEPFNDKSRVRYRIDGILRETAMLPGHLHSAIISRIKVMSDLKLDETDGVTGFLGLRLNEAIRKFQKRNSLKVDGRVNPGGETLDQDSLGEVEKVLILCQANKKFSTGANQNRAGVALKVHF